MILVQVGMAPHAHNLSSDQFMAAVHAGQVAPDVPCSLDGGRSYIPARDLHFRLVSRGSDETALLVPQRVETYSTLAQYLGLFSLLFLGGPISALALIVAWDPGTSKLGFRLAVWLVALVLGPLPIGLMSFLGLRALRRDPTQRGKGRAIFGVVAAALMALPLLLSLPLFLIR